MVWRTLLLKAALRPAPDVCSALAEATSGGGPFHGAAAAGGQPRQTTGPSNTGARVIGAMDIVAEPAQPTPNAAPIATMNFRQDSVN